MLLFFNILKADVSDLCVCRLNQIIATEQKFIMPRRAPPSTLRLVSGALPTRGQPKHTMPVVPQPTFYPRPSSAQPRVTRATVPPYALFNSEEKENLNVSKQDSSEDAKPGRNSVHKSVLEDTAPETETQWTHSWIPVQTNPFVFNVESALPSLPKAILINSYS